MKKIILLIIIIVPLCTNAQFKATYHGFRSLEDKEFLILNYNQVPVHKLYLLTERWINRTQYNPNIYTKDVEDESISVHTGDTIKLPTGLIKTIISIDYTLNFEFKDGKVKLLPIIHSMTAGLHLYFGFEKKKQNLNNFNLFKPDGTVRGKSGKILSNELNEWLNKKTKQYDDFMKSNGGEDEW